MIHNFTGQQAAEKLSLPSLPYTHIVVHYSEIGTKGKNRSMFENKLRRNIQFCLKRLAPGHTEPVQILRGRFLIPLLETHPGKVQNVISILGHIFGIAYVAPAMETSLEKTEITNTVIGLCNEIDFDSFRISTRRSNHNFPFSSQTMNEDVGATIQNKFNKKVDLSNPALNCHIDLLDKSGFVYGHRFEGPGGLPEGVSGKVVIMMSGGIDSPVASYFARRRGADPLYVHFHSIPFTTEASVHKVRDLISVLSEYGPKQKLILVPFGEIQNEIMDHTPVKFRVLLYRRFMLRIVTAIADQEGAKAIYTGEALGQVASQTLENMDAIQRITNIPVMRPLIGFDKNDIIAIARDIGTYDISILPHEDCCTLYVPKHPATRATPEDLDRAEEASRSVRWWQMH